MANFKINYRQFEGLARGNRAARMRPSPPCDSLLLTVPNQLGVDYNAHVIDSILTHVAPALGWR